MYTFHKVLAIGTLGTILLGGCASDPFSTRSDYPNNNYPSNTSYPDNRNHSNTISYGVIDSIETVNSNNTSSNSSIGVGTVLGGVVGGVGGNQVGSGNGRTAATAVGAVGGAIIGHEIEKSRNNQPTSYNYRVGVRLDNGGYDNVMQNTIGNLRVGDRVRIENSTVTRY
jgi:outer membrane lipoprotein SlyB